MLHLELHLYEGFISRFESQSWIQSSLSMFGTRRPKGVDISDTWQASAITLLSRIFQKWSPSDKQSTTSLCENLCHFIRSLSAHITVVYVVDNSNPPVVKVGAIRRVEIKAFIIYHLQYPSSNQIFFVYRHQS